MTIDIDLPAPRMPELSDEWIAARIEHLIDEITAQSRPAGRLSARRVAIAGGIAVAASAIALAVGFVGPGTQSAFAGWVFAPMSSHASQTAATASACQQEFASGESLLPDAGAPSGPLPPISLTDTRCPF